MCSRACITRQAGLRSQRRNTAPLPLIGNYEPSPESRKMKTLRILAINAIALFCVQAFAQEASTPAQSSQDAAALSVGGSIAPQTEMGAPTGKSREQV